MRGRGDSCPKKRSLAFVREQRWFGAKSRERRRARGSSTAPSCERRAAGLADALVEIRYGSGKHDLYQLIVGAATTADPAAGDRRRRGDDLRGGRRPAFARALVDLIGRGAMLETAEGTIEFCGVRRLAAEAPSVARRAAARRRAVEHLGRDRRRADREGLPPHRGRREPRARAAALLRHARVRRTCPSCGAGGRTRARCSRGSLGMVQRVRRRRRRRLDARASRSSRPTRTAFVAPDAAARRGDRRACTPCSPRSPTTRRSRPRTASPESLALLTRHRRRADRRGLPEPARDRGDRADRRPGRRGARRCCASSRPSARSASASAITATSTSGRCSGSDGDWIVIDFEGEPARPLPERRLKHSPLRDVAGMLRSFTYAARVAGVERRRRRGAGPRRASSTATSTRSSAPTCCRRARRPSGCCAIYELEKAVYELRYELANRPDWVSRARGGNLAPTRASRDVTVADEVEQVVRARPPGPAPPARRARERRQAGRRPRVPARRGARPRAARGRRAGRARAQPSGRRLRAARCPGAMPLALPARRRLPGRRCTSSSTIRTRSCRRSASSTSTSPSEGRHERLYEKLGAHVREVDGVRGTAFAVWAPNARSVSVVGDFNSWDGRLHQMRTLGASGIWELFLPGVGDGARYKFELRRKDGTVQLRADPYALATEQPPQTASVVHTLRARVGGRRVDRAAASVATAGTSRSRSTRCTSARGGRASATSSWPSSSARTSATWASRTSSCCRSWSTRSAARGATR